MAKKSKFGVNTYVKKTKPKIGPNVDPKTRPKRPTIKVDKNKIIPTPK